MLEHQISAEKSSQSQMKKSAMQTLLEKHHAPLKNAVPSCSHAACSEIMKNTKPSPQSSRPQSCCNKNQVEKGLEFVVEHAHAKTINDIPNCHANGKNHLHHLHIKFRNSPKTSFQQTLFCTKTSSTVVDIRRKPHAECKLPENVENHIS